MPLVRTPDGVRIAYERFGDGDRPLVLLLMGVGMRGAAWGEATTRLRDHGYAVVTLDNRGAGDSETPRRPFTMATMADDAVAVLDALGAERAHVVGASMGGMIAQELALRHPHRVAGLGLVSTSAGLPRLDFIPPGSLGVLLAALVGRRREVTPEQRVRAMLRFIASDAFAEQVDLADPRLATMVAAMGDRMSRRGYLLQLLAAGSHARWGALGRLRAPTLVQHGERDRVISVAAGRALAARIPGARLETYADAGHVLALQRPESIDALARFFAGGPLRSERHDRRSEHVPERSAEQPDRPEGEDHREGPPGYDLDEQEAIHELEGSEAGGREDEGEAPDPAE